MPSYKEIEKMSQMMDKMGLTEVKLETSVLFGVIREEIHLSKQQNIVAAAAPVAQVAPVFAEARAQKPEAIISDQEKADQESKAASLAGALKSPMVGVVYLSPEPGAKPFTSVGAKVKSGETLALIEAMKTFNPVKTEKDGVVKEILITDGQAVEFDQPLIVVE